MESGHRHMYFVYIMRIFINSTSVLKFLTVFISRFSKYLL